MSLAIWFYFWNVADWTAAAGAATGMLSMMGIGATIFLAIGVLR